LTRLAVSRGEMNLRAALDAIPQMVWSARADGYQDYYNRRWYEFTGTSKEQAVGEGWFRQLHPDDRDRALQGWHESLATGAPYEIECRLRAADGSYVWKLGRALPVRDPRTGAVARWYGTGTNIDELMTARRALSAALDAKEVLLQEVNHRVKNSLQLVSSLLTLQAASLRGADSKDVLADARARLSVIARLHQRLYQGGTHDSVDLFSYLQELCVDSLAAVQRESRTDLVFEAAEAGRGIALQTLWPIDKAVPIALIVSELVTNAVKHAFPDGGGVLRVLMDRDGTELRILIEDDGPGLPEGFDAAQVSGVGMRVVTALIRQLGGRIQSGPSRSGTGAAFTVIIPRGEP
jgi:PAS domain S-box-containing protein